MSAGLNFLPTLQKIKTINELAHVLGVEPKVLTWVAFKFPDAARYSTFKIPKASGGVRTISKPAKPLAHIQSRLANLLTNCLGEIERAHNETRPVSHAFREDRSIYSNARTHQRKRFVFNVDIEDFFPSIHMGRVAGFFEKSRDFELNSDIARIIAGLVCAKGVSGTFLPQGSPSSPIVSNIIARPLDLRLRQIARRRKCRYSRYADDITFSTNALNFPSEIALPKSDAPSTWIVGDRLKIAIESAGFSINSSKTRMQRRGSRQVVTGLVVNEKLNLERTTYKALRAATERLIRTDSCDPSHMTLKSVEGRSGKALLNTIEGKLNHLYQTRRQAKVPKASAFELTGPDLLYSRFLYYRRFFSLDRPLIVTEGPTDIIYLKLALINRIQAATGVKTAVPDLPVSFLRITDKVRHLIGLGDGSDLQKKVMEIYVDRMRSVGSRLAPHPVIFLGDNDDGANALMGAVRKRNKPPKKTDLRKVPFMHFALNLYVALTPELSGKSSTIEDFLDPKCLQEKLGGKTFSPKKGKLDDTLHFGKVWLAERVVKANADKYDFSGFDPILDRIDEIIRHYQAQIA